MTVMQLNQYKSFHKNGWNISLCNNMIELVRDEEFFCIQWTINSLHYNMWFRYGQYNYFEIYDSEKDIVKYCSNKRLMKERNELKDWWNEIISNLS